MYMIVGTISFVHSATLCAAFLSTKQMRANKSYLLLAAQQAVDSVFGNFIQISKVKNAGLCFATVGVHRYYVIVTDPGGLRTKFDCFLQLSSLLITFSFPGTGQFSINQSVDQSMNQSSGHDARDLVRSPLSRRLAICLLASNDDLRETRSPRCSALLCGALYILHVSSVHDRSE